MERRDHVVNERQYSILLPPPTSAMPLCARAAVLVGTLAGLFADMETLVNPDTPKEVKIGKALEKLAQAISQVDPIAANQLMMDAAYAGHLTCGNDSISTEVDFNRHFADKRADIYPVLIWCLWECISDFFPQLGTSTQAIKSAVMGAFQSPKDGAQTTG